jgi:hypothetical protein
MRPYWTILFILLLCHRGVASGQHPGEADSAELRNAITISAQDSSREHQTLIERSDSAMNRVHTFISITGSIGISCFSDPYLYRSFGIDITPSSAIVASAYVGNWAPQVRFQTAFQFNGSLPVSFAPDDHDGVELSRVSLICGYRVLGHSMTVTGAYLGLGLSRLRSIERLRDNPPFREIDGVPIHSTGSSGERYYEISDVHYGLVTSVSLMQAILGGGLFSPYVGVNGQVDWAFANQRGIFSNYNSRYVTLEVLIGVALKLH